MAQQFKSVSYQNLVSYDACGNVLDNGLLLPGQDVLTDVEMQDVQELQKELFKPTCLLVRSFVAEIELNDCDAWVFEYLTDKNGRKIAANVLRMDGVTTKLHQRAFLMSDYNPRLNDWNMNMWRIIYPNLKHWKNDDMNQDADNRFPPEWELQEPEYIETKMMQQVKVTESKLEEKAQQSSQLEARVMQNLENTLYVNPDGSIVENVNLPKSIELSQCKNKMKMDECQENFADAPFD